MVNIMSLLFKEISMMEGSKLLGAPETFPNGKIKFFVLVQKTAALVPN